MADILALWPILLFWPAVVLSVLVAGLGILRRRVPLLVTAAVLVGPASLYLAASPGFGLVGLTPIAAYLLASAAIRRDRLKGWRNARGGHSRRCVREIIEPVTARSGQPGGVPLLRERLFDPDATASRTPGQRAERKVYATPLCAACSTTYAVLRTSSAQAMRGGPTCGCPSRARQLPSSPTLPTKTQEPTDRRALGRPQTIDPPGTAAPTALPAQQRPLCVSPIWPLGPPERL